MKRAKTKQRGAILQQLADKIIAGGTATRRDALTICRLQGLEELFLLLVHAHAIRKHFRGNVIQLCAIVNAKSGRCSEDCMFCAQSSYYHTSVRHYALIDKDRILAAAQAAQQQGARHFSIVTSGRGISSRELTKVCDALRVIAQQGRVIPCASLGILSRSQLAMLREAGLKRYHHNLETASSYFRAICSTHRFEERVQTVRNAQETGLEICAGGIVGLGETWEQRMELAFALRDLGVDSVPLNFLHPIPGTPAARLSPPAPLEILQTIALFRFILPRTEIRICGGREVGLRTLQPFLYLAGADGIMIGNYLTTSGRSPAIDRQEIVDLGLSYA